MLFAEVILILACLTGCNLRESNTGKMQGEAQIKAEAQLEELLNQGQTVYSTQFTVDNQTYKVTAINTMEKHRVSSFWSGDTEYYIYQIFLQNEKGEVLQQFTHDGKDITAELFCDDLNFDGFPDLEMISSYYENGGSAGDLYLWDVKENQFSEKAIELPKTYVVHEKEKVFSLISQEESGESETICRLNNKGEMDELRSYTLNLKEGYVQIWDAEEQRFLIKEKFVLTADGKIKKADDYQAILWSDLPGSEEELQSYWTIEADGYEVELKDLIPEQSLQLVIHKKKEPDIIAKVYHIEQDYQKPTEFSAASFEDLLGRNGFYIYQLQNGMFPFVYYYALEEEKIVKLAESWGGDPLQSNFMVDVNGDGDRELICNVVYFADGGRRTLIYYDDGMDILQGFCDDLLDVSYDDFGVGATSSAYLPEERVVHISFWKDELGDFDSRDYKIWLDKIELTPYNAID